MWEWMTTYTVVGRPMVHIGVQCNSTLIQMLIISVTARECYSIMTLHGLMLSCTVSVHVSYSDVHCKSRLLTEFIIIIICSVTAESILTVAYMLESFTLFRYNLCLTPCALLITWHHDDDDDEWWMKMQNFCNCWIFTDLPLKHTNNNRRNAAYSRFRVGLLCECTYVQYCGVAYTLCCILLSDCHI